jgi:pimeloyl-ACP methyl ester carboxylesterase
MNGVLNHVDRGAGDPALVFVHGLACALEDWDAQVRALSARHRCIAVDLPGHGASPAGGALRIARFGEQVEKSVRALDAAPAVLIGHSMGCRVVLDAARRLAGDVAALVLVDGSLRGSGDAEAARAATRATIQAAGFANYANGLFDAMFTPHSDEALRRHIVARALRLDADAGTELIADLAAWDAAQMDAALAAVRAPLLLIQSTGVDAQRNRVPLQPGQSTPWVDRVCAGVPGARVEIIPGVGHFTMHDAAERVTGLIAEFAAAA